MPRPIRASIDLSALRHNLALARHHGGAARVWSVVKANAYGHGLLPVAQALAAGTDGFALLDLDEAIALREAGLRHPILLLEGCFHREDFAVAAEFELTPALHCEAQVEDLIRARLPVRLPVFLKLNSGMNRLGLPPARFRAALERLEASGAAASVTLMTHFSDADGEQGIGEQMAVIEDAWAGLPHPRCIANSAALLRYPQAVGAGVRPGIMLYGGSPFPQLQSAESLGLRPVMTLRSEVIGVQELAPGQRVGYGGLFEATEAMRVGVVACGYADGYPRHAGTGTPVLVAGRRTRTLGRVSMDMLAVDLAGLPEAGVGAPVVLWGEGLPADEVAAAAGTISYELFCALAPRVPAEYRR